MSRKHQRRLTLGFVTSDMLAAIVALFLAYVLRFHTALFSSLGATPDFRPYASLLPFIALLWPISFSSQGLYRFKPGRSLIDETFGIAVGAIVAAVFLFGTDAYYRLYSQRAVAVGDRFEYSRLFVGLFLAANVGLTVAGRALVRARVARQRRRGINVRQVLIVGAGRVGRRVAERLLLHPEYGLKVAGFVDDDPTKKGTVIAGAAVRGTTGDILGIVRGETIDEMIVALPWSSHTRLLEILEATSKEYLAVKVVPDLLDYIAIRAGIEDLDGVPVLNLGEDPLHGWDWFLKRVFDIVASGLGLLILSPLLAGIAWLVRRSSPGPVFYRQERLGLDGKRFVMHKFRTMYENAEARTGPVFAEDVDPRCTAIGHRLRAYYLDELPQLWNVLRGDMSIVGPRPERPAFVDEFRETVPRYMHRHRMKSGITGWAQVHGWRGNTSIERRIEHDLYYVTNWSLALDFRVLWLTIVHVFH